MICRIRADPEWVTPYLVADPGTEALWPSFLRPRPPGAMSTLSIIAVRVLVTLLAVVASVGQVAYLDALSWHKLGWASQMSAQMSPPFLTLMTTDALVSFVAAVLSIVLVLHEGRRQAAARALALALGAWSYLTAYSGVTVLLQPHAGTARALFEAHFLLVEMVGLVGLVRFTALFPEPLVAEQLEPPPNLPGWLRPVHSVSVWMLRPSAPWVVGGLLLLGLWGLMIARGKAISDAGLSPIMDLVRLLAASLVVLNLRRTWGRSSDVGRLSWLLVALVCLLSVLLLIIGGNVLMGVTEWPEPPFAWRALLLDVGVLAFLAALAMSVLYRGAANASVAVRRIASLATVVTLGLFLAAGLEALFHGGMLAGFSLRTGVGTLIAFVFVVSTYRSLMRYLEGFFADLHVPGVADEQTT